MSEELPGEEIHRAVDDTIEELLAHAGVTAPPVDARKLAEHFGIVLRTARPTPRGKSVAMPRPEPTEEQRQLHAAQAVGAHLKPDILRRLGVDPEARRGLIGESLVNRFAAHLLTPACWFADDARAVNYDLFALRERYRTASHELIAWRWLDLPEPCVVTLVEEGKIRRRRSNAWRVRRELAEAEQTCLRALERSGEPCAAHAGGWSARGWPLPDGVRRALLRGVVEDEEAVLLGSGSDHFDL